MAVFQLDQNVLDHPKVRSLSNAEFRLWLASILFCQKFLTDGRIAVSDLRNLQRYSRQNCANLIAKGFWCSREQDVEVRDYLQWNISRETVLALRDAAKKRMHRTRAVRANTASGSAARSRERTTEHTANTLATCSEPAKTTKTPAVLSTKTKTSGIVPTSCTEAVLLVPPIYGVEPLPRSTPAPSPLPAEPALLTFPTVGKDGNEWAFTDSYRAELATAYPNLDVLSEAQHALQWVRASPTHRKTVGGMKAFLVGWLNRSTNTRRSGAAVITGSLKTAGNAAAMDELLRRRTGRGLDE